MDKKNTHGGARKNSGRLKKDEIISLIQTMDAIKAPKDIWAALATKVKKGDTIAIKTWLQYRYGMPKQVVDSTTTLNINDYDLKDFIK